MEALIRLSVKISYFKQKYFILIYIGVDLTFEVLPSLKIEKTSDDIRINDLLMNRIFYTYT